MLRHLSAAQARGDADSELSDALLEELQEFTVTINPAGFIYLKNILIHFEFYSALVGEYDSLFVVGLRRSNDRRYQFEFEECIEKVHRLVRKHCDSMDRFFKYMFLGQLGWDQNRYRRSKFAFKHFGEGRPKNEGLFHGTRIITAHVDYIDKFRLWLLENIEDLADGNLGTYESIQALAIDVNKRLVKLVARNVGLLDQSVDDAVRVFQENFGAHIKAIRNTGFQDFEMEISAFSS